MPVGVGKFFYINSVENATRHTIGRMIEIEPVHIHVIIESVAQGRVIFRYCVDCSQTAIPCSW